MSASGETVEQLEAVLAKLAKLEELAVAHELSHSFLQRQVADLEARLSRPPRAYSSTSWTLPKRAPVKPLLKQLLLAGFGPTACVNELERLVPFLPRLFDPMPSRQAFLSRLDWGARPGPGGSTSEWPEIHPLTKPYWEVAGEVVRRGLPLTWEEWLHILEHKRLPTPLQLDSDTPESPNPDAPTESNDDSLTLPPKPDSGDIINDGGSDIVE
jgi:hypothetical protein